jgi:protein-S-isoprenylcysteine O-methyltransferase Ste14
MTALMDDRQIRAVLIVVGHIMWLSAAALRIIRGDAPHAVSSRSSWVVEKYPLVVWIPLLAATFFFANEVDLDVAWRYAGLAIALAASLFSAWAMWSLGRGYGVGTDVFEGRALKTEGAYAFVRHPMYLGITGYHVGGSLALESLTLLIATLVFVVPYTALRIGAEERVLSRAFGTTWSAYARRVPALLPFPR